jgi:glycosyltransferase involved in cell wall biosynthesis
MSDGWRISVPKHGPVTRVGLFLGIGPNAGGMFQYAQSLLAALSTYPPAEYQIEVACVGSAWHEKLAGYPFRAHQLRGGEFGLFMANAIMAARIPGQLTRAFSRSMNPIAWQLKRLRCDVWIFPAQDAIGYQVGVKTISTVHDLMHRYEPRFPEVVRGRRYAIREHRFGNLVAWASGVLVDSEVGRTHVVESYRADPEKVYPLPYVSSFKDSSSTCSAYSGTSVPGKFFLYPAQFWPHKNHATLVAALAIAKAKCPDIHLVLSGSRTREFEKVVSQAAKLGLRENISFPGYVSEKDLEAFYKRARALIMPTFFGPTNIPPLEAMSCGCPVAVSGIYGMPEQCGEAALYFDPRSTEDVATVLERLWMDDGLCAQLAAKGREKMASWGAVQFAARLRQIIDDVWRRPVAQPHYVDLSHE